MKRALPWVVTLAASAAAVALVATRPAQLPTYEAVRADYRPSEAWLLDRNGDVLDSRRIDLGVRRLAWTPLEAISPALSDTIVEREDRRFAQHRGVDWRATAGALRDTLQGRRRGASTLTMQLAALLDAERDGHRHRGLGGKLRQARLALQLESRWTKPQILEAYLNLLPFRGELQGIGAAAWMLAGKTPAGLTRDESLVFAALLPHPSARAESVARRACAGLPADCDALAITARRLLARAPRQPLTESLAPHLAASLLRRAGERRTTTLDREVQRVASAALTRQLDGLSGRNVRDGAALVVDNATGDVLAYVGSAGRTSTASAVDGVRARRQAGSTLKPFLYGLALERRYLTAASLLDDSPVSIDTATGLYLPRDYDHRYKGAVSVRTALAGSLNVPAVRALQLVGVEPFRERLNDLGYASIDQDGAYYGFALALGSAEVSLWEQASAFRSLALQGQGSDLRVLPDDVPAPLRSVASPAAAFVIADILSDRAARAITFGLDSSLATPYWSAVKTGTSKDMRDNWCVGFTRDFTVAVWVGNFEGDSMHDVSGISGAAPAWRAIMDSLQPDGASKPLPAPAEVRSQPLRFASALEPPRTEWFIEGTAPGELVQPVVRARQRVRISNPVDGTLIALDPDIPARLQRVPLEIEGAASGYRLALDDKPLPENSPQLWQPTPGTHRLALLEPSGREVDRVQFVVR